MQPVRNQHEGSLIALMNAQHGIERLRELPQEYGFYLRGTLASLRSVADYLLEEYNQQFGLGVPVTHELGVREFREIAEQSGNQQALQFIRAYQTGWQRLMEDRVLKLVLGSSGERNIMMHRTQSQWQVQKIRLDENEMYENVGEPTLHFANREDEGPETETIVDQCQHCMDELSRFRVNLMTTF